MQTYIFILGRNPELSIEELLVVLKPLGQIVEINKDFVIFHGSIDSKELLSQLGGTIKVGSGVQTMSRWSDMNEDLWLKMLRSELDTVQGRFNFGVSLYGKASFEKQAAKRIGLKLKKRLRSMSIRSRFVMNEEGLNSSVVVQKNNLLGSEFLIAEGRELFIGITEAVQDYESYSQRDYGRPHRDLERGMLPPKVAKILLNLAGVKKTESLLDPFCGGGTILQEALLNGLTDVWGTDKDERAVSEAQENLNWLATRFNVSEPHLAVHDIFSLEKAYRDRQFDAVVTEPYLGPARLLKKKSLTRSQLQAIVTECNQLYLHTFQAIRSIIADNGRMVIILPIFRMLGEELTVGKIENFERSGWRNVHPDVIGMWPRAQLSSRGQLIYSRSDQVVAREITMWRQS